VAVIDADGLWLVAQQPEVVRGNRRVVLTPNLVEFARIQV
jgi:ATP-dependent NAD(P)H-hydrate dehydratase